MVNWFKDISEARQFVTNTLKTEQVYANKLRGGANSQQDKPNTTHCLLRKDRPRKSDQEQTWEKWSSCNTNNLRANKCEQAKTDSHVQVGAFQLLVYQMVWRKGF